MQAQVQGGLGLVGQVALPVGQLLFSKDVDRYRGYNMESTRFRSTYIEFQK